MSRRLVTVTLALGVAVLATGCLPTSGTVDIAGDSVTDQALAYTAQRPGATAGADTGMVRWGWGCHDVEGILEWHVAAGRPETLIWALGPNDAHPTGGGWTLSDLACWHDALHSVHETACVVVVLPGYGPGIDPAWAAEIDRVDDHLDVIVDGRPDTVVVDDWARMVAERPGLLTADGIHISGAEAAEARLGLYAAGADQCGGAQ